MKIIVHTVALLFLSQLGLSQTKSEFGLLLDKIAQTEKSENIVESVHSQKIMSYEDKALLILSEFFTDKSETNIYSGCNERILTKGELAIILTDRIEGMPYATLTGIQNCLLTFCDNNLNLIEYYLNPIQEFGSEKFQANYNEWLASNDRKKWSPMFTYKTKEKRKRIKNKSR